MDSVPPGRAEAPKSTPPIVMTELSNRRGGLKLSIGRSAQRKKAKTATTKTRLRRGMPLVKKGAMMSFMGLKV